MKKVLHSIILLTFCLLAIQVNAKTVYYVKSGATGTGTSWNNASGSIQAMIDQASPGDEVWIAGGTYYPEKEYEWSGSKGRTFKLKTGVSLYGGFFGSETSIQQRKKIDRDNNGEVEAWEFQYETILSGEGDVKDVWTRDDENRILEVKNNDDNSDHVVSFTKNSFEEDGVDNDIKYFFSGITVTNGYIGLYFNYYKCAIIVQECDFYNNHNGISDNYTSTSSFITINNCNIHHNIFNGVVSSRCIMNTYIHHNGTGVFSTDLVKDSEIYQNRELGIRGKIIHNCSIYDNAGCGLQGFQGSTAYNCHIFGNEDGGAKLASLYDCIIENNTTEGNGGGTSDGSLYNCIIRNNFAVGNGGGCYGGNLKNCKIYNNEALNDAGGVFSEDVLNLNCSIFNNKAGGNGGGVFSDYSVTYYNCDIYNNYAVSYGGVKSGSYINCTIANNKSISGNDNTGDLTNCILKGTFEGDASYSTFTDSYIRGNGNFLVTDKELKFVKSTSFIGNASNEKQLTELTNADFSLSKGSLAIDMGKSGYLVPIEDRSRYPRPMGEKTDIGAHEYLSFKALPYENKFEEASLSMNFSGGWKNGKLPGKSDSYLYYDRKSSYRNYSEYYVTTTFF